MKMKIAMLFVMLGVGLLVACGPSPEQQATMTAAAWTPTPSPTPTPTPIPINVEVRVIDESGNPINGVQLISPETGSNEPLDLDENASIAWHDFQGGDISFNAWAQGYSRLEESHELQRGPNLITLTMKRDPFGVLPGEACLAGEEPLMLEDFQDNEASNWQSGDSKFVWEVANVAGEDGNIGMIFDLSIVTPGPEVYGSAFYQDPEQIFGDAVLRVLYKSSDIWTPQFSWRIFGTSDFEDKAVAGSWYPIVFVPSPFNTINLHRQVELMGGAPYPGNLHLFTSFRQVIDQWHLVEISTFGSETQIWVDGILKLRYTDRSVLPEGWFALGPVPVDRETDTVLVFDNITVCGISEPFVSAYVAPETMEE